MKRTLCAVGLGALCLTWAPSPAHAVTGAICISSTLNGSLRLRATGTCKAKEIRIGSFDGTTLQFSGINVQVVSGSGATDSPVNGKGNLIIGYNAALGSCFISAGSCATDADCPADTCVGGSCSLFTFISCTTDADCLANQCRGIPLRTGSHNLVIGDQHTFTSYGGLVAGYQNTINGVSASVSGGASNTAGDYSSVSGGYDNSAHGLYSSASGGQSNNVSGHLASVSGGASNLANGTLSSISGGATNTASGNSSSVCGGITNTAGGGGASVGGGLGNNASGKYSSVSGGAGLTQPVDEGWAAGSVTPGNAINGDFESP